jgi:YcaO-like protein with predicted kinase domain
MSTAFAFDSLKERVQKTFTHGTHRTASPGETLARARPLALAMGITRIGNITGLDRIGIPVAISVRPRSRSVTVSQGKGVTLQHAFASALMESIEAFHGEEPRPDLRHEAYCCLSSKVETVAPSILWRTSKPLTPETIIPWTEGYDVLRHVPCWVPAETTHTDFAAPRLDQMGYFVASTNGLASGNHRLEAVCGAICELVERDAIALWEAKSLSERAACRLDSATIGDETCLALLNLYDRAGFSVHLWNVTSDIGIPAFLCDIRAQIEDPSGMNRRFRGAGCHPSRAIALSRALTEAAQVRLTHIVGIRDDITAEAYEETLAQRTGGALLDALARSIVPYRFGDVADFTSDDVAVDVRWILERLQAAGLENVIIVDLTRTDYGIPVVRVVIPGLEGDCSDPEYHPGNRARIAVGVPS